MIRAKEANIKINIEKIQYKVSSVNYMGHVLTTEGVKADKSKVKAIAEMPPPTDKAGLQRMQGMTKHLAQYIPSEATMTVLLRQLLQKNRFFDLRKQLIIQADASKDGLWLMVFTRGPPGSLCIQSIDRDGK